VKAGVGPDALEGHESHRLKTGRRRRFVGFLCAPKHDFASEGRQRYLRPHAGSEPGFELVARLTPDDWMLLSGL
jgi:hypothetical protein